MRRLFYLLDRQLPLASLPTYTGSEFLNSNTEHVVILHADERIVRAKV